MIEHVAAVRGRIVTWDDRRVVQHGMGADRVVLDLDAEWDACDRIQVALACAALPEPVRVVPEGRALLLSARLLAEPGQLRMQVVGYEGEAVRIVTEREASPLVVVESGDYDGAVPPEPDQPDLWAKLMADVEAATEAASGAAESANEAAAKAVSAASSTVDGERQRVQAESSRTEAERSRLAAESSRSDSEAGRAKAESDRAAAEKARATAEEARAESEADRERRVAEAVSKADAASKRADEAAKSASENILVGTKTAGLVHVEDAWPTRLRECRVLGKSVQDGMPASDDPKPITSVGKAEVLVRGGNLVDVPDQVLQVYDNVITDQSVLDEFERLPRDTPLVFSCAVEPLGPNAGEVVFYDKDDGGGLVHLGTLRNNGVPLVIKRGEVKQVNLIGGLNQDGRRTIGNIQVAAAKSKYAAPVRLSATQIDLQGNELRSLPDGTRDELVIDASGAVVLRKRVGVTTGAEIAAKVQSVNQGSGLPYIMANVLPAFPSSISAVSMKVMSDRYVSAGNTMERNCYRTWTSLMIVDERFTSKEEARRILREENATFLAHIPDHDMPIGKVSVPALPKSTSNVWNAGDIPIDVSATYVRDVTLAFADLESKLTQAVVAAVSNI